MVVADTLAVMQGSTSSSLSGMNEPIAGQVFRAYAVAAMAAGAAMLLDMIAWLPLLRLTAHEDPIAGPGTIAGPVAWGGFCVVAAAFWVALEWWLPRRWLIQAALMGVLVSLLGYGYLIGDPTGASTFPLRLQGLAFVVPIGLVIPAAALFTDRLFKTMRWYWMAAIAVGFFVQNLATLAAFAGRIGNVPVVYPILTGLLFSALTIIRWSRSEEEAKESPVVRRLATTLIVAIALVGLATGFVTI